MERFTFAVGSLVVTEVDPNTVEIFNEVISKTFTVTTDDGSAVRLAIDVLFRGTGLDKASVMDTFETTCPGITVLQKAS